MASITQLAQMSRGMSFYVTSDQRFRSASSHGHPFAVGQDELGTVGLHLLQDLEGADSVEAGFEHFQQ